MTSKSNSSVPASVPRAPRAGSGRVVARTLEDAGYTTAAINFTCYRGRNRHASAVPAFTRRPAYGPKRFFFYNLFESDVTGAPLAVFGRSAGSVDAYAAAVGRWPWPRSRRPPR